MGRRRETIPYHTCEKTDYRTVSKSEEITGKHDEHEHQICYLSPEADCIRERYLKACKQKDIYRIEDDLPDCNAH